MSGSALANRRILLACAVGALLAGGIVAAWRARRGGTPSPSNVAPPLGPLSVRATLTDESELTLLLPDGRSLPLGRLAEDDEPAAAVAVEALREELVRVTADPSTRDACDGSLWTLEVSPGATCPWRTVLWTLQSAIAPPARVHRVRFLLLGGPGIAVDHELPRDSCGPTRPPSLEPVHALEIRLSRPAPAAAVVARVVIADERRVYGRGIDRRAAERVVGEVAPHYDLLRAAVSRARGPDRATIGVVELRAPDGPDVAYGEVLAALRALRDEGFAPVELWEFGRRAPRAR